MLLCFSCSVRSPVRCYPLICFCCSSQRTRRARLGASQSDVLEGGTPAITQVRPPPRSSASPSCSGWLSNSVGTTTSHPEWAIYFFSFLSKQISGGGGVFGHHPGHAFQTRQVPAWEEQPRGERPPAHGNVSRARAPLRRGVLASQTNRGANQEVGVQAMRSMTLISV